MKVVDAPGWRNHRNGEIRSSLFLAIPDAAFAMSKNSFVTMAFSLHIAYPCSRIHAMRPPPSCQSGRRDAGRGLDLLPLPWTGRVTTSSNAQIPIGRAVRSGRLAWTSTRAHASLLNTYESPRVRIGVDGTRSFDRRGMHSPKSQKIDYAVPEGDLPLHLAFETVRLSRLAA